MRAIVVNSGCANACTGADGHAHATEMTRLTSAVVGCPPESVLVASTGVIGVKLVMANVARGINDAAALHELLHELVRARLRQGDGGDAREEQLLGEPVQKVLGDGLFERVHVADRPAYLTALSRCYANNETIAVEFRVRRAGASETSQYAWVEMRCRPMRSVDDAGHELRSPITVIRGHLELLEDDPSGMYYRMHGAKEVERYDDIRWTGELPQQPQVPQ